MLYRAQFEMTGPPVSRFLDDKGDGSGNIDIIEDYSAEPTDFYFQCPAGSSIAISELMVYIRSTAIEPGQYGSLPALTNGVNVVFRDTRRNPSEVELGPRPMKDVDDFYAYTTDCRREDFKKDRNEGGKIFQARYNYSAGIGTMPIMEPGDAVIVRVNDDFTGIGTHLWLLRAFETEHT